MTNTPRGGAVLYAKDVRRLLRFYAGVAALDVDSETSDHVVLGSTAFQLVVVKVPEALAAHIEIAQPAVRRQNTPIKLVFFVASVAASRECAVTLGGSVDAVEAEWRFQGYRVCDGQDPEGNVFQLREASVLE